MSVAATDPLPAAGLTPGDLTVCDLEQIQFLGSLQPHAFLLEISADWLVGRVSANIGAFLPTTPEAALGRPLAEVLGADAVHEIRGQLQVDPGQGVVHRLAGVRVGEATLDFTIHRSGETTVVEGEAHEEGGASIASTVQTLILQLRQLTDFNRLCSQVARQVRAISGFDRVLIYRFGEDGSGEVIAETKRSELPSFKGLRFPATDIPKQARALYERNLLRLICDVAAANVPIVPALDPAGRPIDLSQAGARAVSPVHIEYLRNMGVGASMSISILAGGKLWGLIACHHRTRRRLAMPVRAGLEFFGLILSSIFERQLAADAARRQEASRALHLSILNALGNETSTLEDAIPHLRGLQGVLGADGFATFVEGRLRSSGTAPTPEQTLGLMQFLNRAAASRVYATHALSSVYPEAAAFADVASGIMAVPVSRKPRDFVVFFRREVVHGVDWAGNPAKTMAVTDDGQRISPRHSFAAWHETVRGQSAHWGAADCEIGESLRVSLIEVMLQATDRAEKQRKISNDQQDLLIAELNHRVRNILNLITGLVRQVSDGAADGSRVAGDISARVHALARAHDQLTSSGWGARSVASMIRVEAAAYLAERADRVVIHGADAQVQPDAFSTLALVIHELMTNAAKYGAFRDSHGAVDIDLSRDEAGLSILWREHGAGTIKEPTRRGFGSTIIERAIPHELSGKVELRFEPDGLVARLLIPSAYLAEGVAGPAPEVAAPVATGAAEAVTGSVLLVEDNLLIALETEDVLYGLGAADVFIASTVGAALSHLHDNRPDFAVLDYNLGREQSTQVAERLAGMGVPFVFASGYGDSTAIDGRFRRYPIIAKPYTARSLLDAFNAAQAN